MSEDHRVTVVSSLEIAASQPDSLRWFKEEVHAHDIALKSYLRRSFPRERDVDDVVQESYLRIWKTRLSSPVASAKALLFQIARRVVVDRARRARTAKTESMADLAHLEILEERPNAAERLSYAEKVRFLGETLANLPDRCRQVMILRKMHGMSYAEIARQLGISERTVDSQLTRGMKLMETRLRERGLEGFSSHER